MKYKVTYLLKNGDKKISLIDARDETAAAKAFQGEGFVASVEKEGISETGAAGGGGFLNFFRRPGDFDLTLFTKELSTLLKAGLTMPESLETIGAHSGNKMLKAAVADIKKDIVAGVSFSQALKSHPEVFPELFARCAAGGEASSNLTGVLDILAQNLKNSHQMKSKMINITLYPLVIISITFCVFAFLLLYVVPSFEAVFHEIRIEIPPHTRLLFFISGIVKKHYARLAAGALILSALAFWGGYIRAAGSRAVKILRAMPVACGLIDNYYLFVFSGMLSSLLRSAAPALESFSISLFALNDIVPQPRREAAMEILKTGGSFSNAVAALELSDETMARMCAVGERSGKISDMIDMINDYYLQNLQNSIERISEVLEPIIIFITGIFIAALILSVFLPIIKITMGGI
ncbi:MAG: putative type II secretion system protein F [bacterium ADurb.Bin243]|nr:MAG: putative type II secretion system protein F [bacterium ADurb.Bin243]HOD40206.1 type II secretion system F family protein [Candidatus Wallbacteria bacterium]